MNQTPATPEIKKTIKPNLILIGSIVGITLLSLVAVSAYVWSMSYAGPVATTKTGSSSMSSMDNSKMNSMMAVTKSVASSTMTTSTSASQVTNLKTLSCPAFDISINTDKYQAGFSGAGSDIKAQTAEFQKEAQVFIENSQKIDCSFTKSKNDTDDNDVLVSYAKDTILECYGCGGGEYQSLRLVTNPRPSSEKNTQKTSVITNPNGLEGIVNKMKFDGMDNKPVVYNSIAFKIKDISYNLTTSAKSSNPTDAENEALLKDALELFNTIKVK